MSDPVERKIEVQVSRLVDQAMEGSRRIHHTYDDLELMFEVWFNYFLQQVGERHLFASINQYDDLQFNMDGYTPTILPVVKQMIHGMSSIGVDLIRPPKEDPSQLVNFKDPMMDRIGDAIAEEMDGVVWILFTVIEQGHPLKGLRYSTAYRDGELIYPPVDPNFTDSYADELVHESARGIFIDNRERVLKHVRQELFLTDVKGDLLP